MSTFAFDRRQHVYTLDGQTLPSVTQILREGGAIDTSHYTQEARDKGSIVHLVTALHDRGKLNEPKFRREHPDCVGRFEAWLAFRHATGCVILLIESPAHHPLYRYAGTIDRLVHWPGIGVTVIDLKPPTKTHAQRLQTAALTALWAESFAIAARGCVHLHDDGTFRWERHPIDWTADFVEFLRLKEDVCQSNHCNH